MASASPSSPSPAPAIDPTPLLPTPRRTRRSGLHVAARILRSRRTLREPSILVREHAAAHIEDRQLNWSHSRPIVFLDILWNLSFVCAAAVVVGISWDERPAMPLRVWVGGYVGQCLVHAVCVAIEWRRRGRVEEGGSSRGSSPRWVPDMSYSSSGQDIDEDNISFAKHLENTNTMFSFVWWIIGFYWVSAGGEDLTRDSPQLYWLCIVFLAFDVFFLIFCVALASVVGIAVCCCLPCIIAILYAVTDQEGATEEDIRLLRKYKFRRSVNSEKDAGDTSGRHGGILTESGSEPPIEHILPAEDAECCICLSAYDDGVELRELPCGHHFHCICIDKWLYINATCPLCKYDILKRGSREDDEV